VFDHKPLRCRCNLVFSSGFVMSSVVFYRYLFLVNVRSTVRLLQLFEF
jgi:hypothetical protein